jgi:aspartate carbamoyltransferase catalytic subunit
MLILEQLIFYQKCKASIINAGDGAHEHPQALLTVILFEKNWEVGERRLL